MSSNYPLSERLRLVFKQHGTNNPQLESELVKVLHEENPDLATAVAKKLIKSLSVEIDEPEDYKRKLYPSLYSQKQQLSRRSTLATTTDTEVSVTDLLYPSMVKK